MFISNFFDFCHLRTLLSSLYNEVQILAVIEIPFVVKLASQILMHVMSPCSWFVYYERNRFWLILIWFLDKSIEDGTISLSTWNSVPFVTIPISFVFCGTIDLSEIVCQWNLIHTMAWLKIRRFIIPIWLPLYGILANQWRQKMQL